MRIEELLFRQRSNKNIAIKEGKRSLNYEEWNLISTKISERINSVSYESKTIALYLPNSIDYVVSYFGVAYADRIIVPIAPQAKYLEILSTLNYCEIDMIITSKKMLGSLLQSLEQYKFKLIIYVVDLDEIIEFNNNSKFVDKTEYIKFNKNDDDVILMLHTSGTTDMPKRVMLTHNNLIANVESNIQSLTLTEKDVVLIALPLFFGYCNTAQFLTHVYLGAKMVLFEGLFMPKQFFSLVETEQITNFTAVPTMLLIILKYRYFNKYNIDSLRYICFGGGKMPINKLLMLMDMFPNIGFVQTYGQTECSPRVTALLPKYSVKKLGSVGKPIPNVKIRIDPKSAYKLDNGKSIGEIEVLGKNVMKGYYKRPDETIKTRDGKWHRTGDLGYIDEDGFLFLTGRIKNIIISGGINIYPEEVEQVILQNNSIKEACVVAKSDDLLGEVPIAYIIVNNSNFKIKDLSDECIAKLAIHKVPKEYIIVETLPKTYNGKIKRGLINDRK